MRTALALLLLVAVAPSCVYVSDRTVDFLDQYRLGTGLRSGGGVRWSFFGLWHTGLIFGVKPQTASFGWKYGRAFLFRDTTDGIGLEVDQSWVVMNTTIEDWDYTSGDYKLARRSFFLLPALVSQVDTTRRDEDRWYVPEEGVLLEGHDYIWSGRTWRENRYAMIHAFDLEFEVALLLNFETGYSPGETLDFLLGLLTIDLAQDDGRIFGAEK